MLLKGPWSVWELAEVPEQVFHRIMAPRSAYRNFLKIEFSTLKIDFYAWKPILALKKLFLLEQNGQNSPGRTSSMAKRFWEDRIWVHIKNFSRRILNIFITFWKKTIFSTCYLCKVPHIGQNLCKINEKNVFRVWKSFFLKIVLDVFKRFLIGLGGLAGVPRARNSSYYYT